MILLRPFPSQLKEKKQIISAVLARDLELEACCLQQFLLLLLRLRGYCPFLLSHPSKGLGFAFLLSSIGMLHAFSYPSCHATVFPLLTPLLLQLSTHPSFYHSFVSALSAG
jgi:hypothetical protein